ncbi:hypothetical protein Nepgr_024779 [Nepenthes gracilis]|uniref:Uncharacterized protein n=1 Tax=Nepenthes gracilis TaxID=150966 RepID=A0AAD3Y0U8_NEPGR|nr:hypothetical protein Nepgr_024779 [Nepenthes gracilis]
MDPHLHRQLIHTGSVHPRQEASQSIYITQALSSLTASSPYNQKRDAYEGPKSSGSLCHKSIKNPPKQAPDITGSRTTIPSTVEFQLVQKKNSKNQQPLQYQNCISFSINSKLLGQMPIQKEQPMVMEATNPTSITQDLSFTSRTNTGVAGSCYNP